MSKLFRTSSIIALLIILFVVTGHAQPPPPPPDQPPCWPPPCVPVDNGILFALCGAVLFGATALWKSLRKRVVE